MLHFCLIGLLECYRAFFCLRQISWVARFALVTARRSVGTLCESGLVENFLLSGFAWVHQ